MRYAGTRGMTENNMSEMTYPDSMGATRGTLRVAGSVGGAFFFEGFSAAFLPFPFAAGGAFWQVFVRAGAAAEPPTGKA